MDNQNLLIIGDVHGKVDQYYNLLEKYPSHRSIQVGDFGFKEKHDWHLDNIDSLKHKINFGNHDDYTYLDQPHSLGNWSYSPHTKTMTVRGAYSIDKDMRIENRDWFANEELNYQEMQEAIDLYEKHKPRIMITHDCPQSVRHTLFGIWEKSITSNGLQAMFEIHQPEMWIFGRFHRSKNELIDSTRFICLEELETILI